MTIFLQPTQFGAQPADLPIEAFDEFVTLFDLRLADLLLPAKQGRQLVYGPLPPLAQLIDMNTIVGGRFLQRLFFF